MLTRFFATPHQRTASSASGFTVVELVIIITIVGLLTGVLFGPMNDLYDSNMKGIRKAAASATAHTALNLMQDTVALSTGFATSISDATPPINGTWSAGALHSGNAVLITSNYTTTVDKGTDATGLRKLTLAANCSTEIKTHYVFFYDGVTKSVYRRSLPPPSTDRCSSTPIGQKRTCAKNYTNGICQGVDALIAKDVESFDVTYYPSPNSNSPTTSYTTASTVVISITTFAGNGYNKVTQTAAMRMSHLN